MAVCIKEASSRRELKRFVTFPNKLYKKNPYYVPQLVSADMATFSPQKNHAFEYCEGRFWLAYDEKGNVVGRVAGIINHNYNKKTGVFYVRFGWLDFVDDAAVVDALMAQVEAWARERNAECVCGPVGFLEFDVAGILVEGYDQLPTAYGKYNAPYYKEHMERLGYAKDVDWVEYNIPVPDTIPDKLPQYAQLLEDKYGCKAVQFTRKKDVLVYADQIFDLLNEQFSTIHGFSELSEGQKMDLKKQFFPMLNMNYVRIVVTPEDKVIGFSICLPSLSKALQKAKGRLFPFGFLHLLYALRVNDTLDTLLMAIKKEYNNKGINALLFNSLFPSIKKGGITSLESTRQLELNYKVLNLSRHYAPTLRKRARCYIKYLATNAETNL